VKIKSFDLEIFAGINNRSYQFKDGLNILLGDNEAGKSTIINAIYASLFIQPQLKLNTKEGKDFDEKFLPYPDGDFAEAQLKIEADNSEYKFYKKWSNSNYAGYLELADGRRIEAPAKIADYKKDILPYAKSTYNNIVFSSQQNIKSTLERINSAENPELIDTINSFLRKAVMELDGVSIDKFRSRLESELEQLTKKWNLASDSIENSARGVNNPYQVGTGEIYNSYIAKEKLRQRLKESKINEKKFEKLGCEIKDLKAEERELIEKIEELSALEAEINQRAAVELELNNLNEKIQKLARDAKKWPEFNKELAEIEKKSAAKTEKMKELEAEKNRAEKLATKQELEKRTAKIKELNAEIKTMKKTISEAVINDEIVNNLEKYKNKIAESRAAIKASRLKAKINFSASDNIKIITGVDGEKNIVEGEIIEADGYLRIKTDQFDIEIESAEIDFSKLKQEYEANKNKFSQLKDKLKIEGLAEARTELAELNTLKRKIEEKEDRVEELLAADKLEDLEEKLQNLNNIEAARDLEKINKELESLKNETTELNTEIKIKKNKIEEWKEEYQSLDELKLDLTKKKEKKIKLEKELENLSSLPEAYQNADEFIDDLKDKRERREKINQSLREKLEEHKGLENSLPETSSREMENELKELEENFIKLKNKADSLLKIKEIFEKKLKEMDENSFEPLVKSFNSNLEQLTAGKYSQALIEKDFSIKLQSKQRRELPGNLDLLSYGTYDAAALAFRFAIFDNLFANYGGFIILDDCLVNLDPKRRENAIKIINEYQKKYQIIYTTCDPKTAAELKGNIIQVEE
jgi:exonuclease SbcC